MTFDSLMTLVDAGDRLAPGVLAELARSPDIIQIGMLADTVRRRARGTTVTFLRVAACPFDSSIADAVPPAAREVRLTGRPDTLSRALAAVASARAVAGERTVSAFSWDDVQQLDLPMSAALRQLREAGLDALAELPLDLLASPAEAIDQLLTAGFQRLRLTMRQAASEARPALFVTAGELQDRFAAIQVINPLPASVNPARPTTGYDDVKSVALARLSAPNIPVVQVDWLRYGPKLAQVALTFGADDLDHVTASDDAPEGRRRTPLEEVRRNIEAAGFVPVERDGRFVLLA